MSRACSLCFGLVAVLASVAAVHGEEAKKPRTDLYGDPLPPGAIARLGTARLRHVNASITFSMDVKTLISAGIDGTVRRWDVVTGKQVGLTHFVQNLPDRESIKGMSLGRVQKQVRRAGGVSPLILHPSENQGADAPRSPWKLFLDASLAPGGSVMAVWRKAGLFLYETATGRRRTRLAIGRTVADGDSVTLNFSRDGKSLMVLHEPLEKKPSLQLWDLVRGEQRPVPSFLGRLTNVALSPDGRQAAARTNSELFLWDTMSGEVLGSTPTDFRGWGLAFAPDGKTIAIAEHGQVTLREPASLKARDHLNSSQGFLNAVVYSRDGRWLAAGGNKGVIVWDTAGRQKPRQLADHQVFNLALAPQGETLACCDWGCTIHLWDVATGRRLHDRPGHSTVVKYLAVSPDGKFLASGAPYDSWLLLWGADTGQLRHSLRGPDSEIGEGVFSPDGKRVIAVGGTSIFQIWDTTTGEHLRRFRFPSLPTGNWGVAIQHSLALSSDGKRLSAICYRYDSGQRDKALACSWNMDTGKLLSRRPYSVERHWWMRDKRGSSWLDVQAAFTPDAASVTARTGRTVNLEDVATGRVLAHFPSYVGRPMTFSADGRLAVAAVLQPKKDPFDGYDMKGLCLIETATGQEVLRINSGERSLADYSLCTPMLGFTPDTQGLVLADAETIRVWATATGEERFRQEWPTDLKRGQDHQPVWSLVILPSDRAATGMDDGTIFVWDLRGRTPSPQRSEPPLDQAALETLWSDLNGDARKAHRAIYRLASAPAQAMPLLRERLRPVEAAETKRIEKLLADLDSEQFAVREAAVRELIQLRDWIEPRLRRSLENKPSPEVRRRLQAILEAASPPLAPKTLRTLRAIAVLERIGTLEARRILEKLAGGAAAPETREAKNALQRLNRR